MSIRFNNWESAFQDEGFLANIKSKIEEALKPVESAINTYSDPGLVSIVVKHLSLGTISPAVTIAEIPFFTETRILVYIRVEYSGDANMSITARLNASPSGEPLPVTITIESLRLRGMLLLEVREEVAGSRDISARFINDPLESVLVSSSLDRQLPFIKGLLAVHITKKIRDFLNHELPDIAKAHIDLPFLIPPEQPFQCVNNLDRLEELTRNGLSGLATITPGHASTKSTNSRGAILTKASMKRL